MLDEGIVPMAKAQAGLLKGVWMRKVSSPSDGVGVVVFATEQQAKDASDAPWPPPGGPEVRGVDIYDVGVVAWGGLTPQQPRRGKGEAVRHAAVVTEAPRLS